jgi:quercetin dioxygenase-like cupin family protein
MGLVCFDEHPDHLVASQYSRARGPVWRSEKLEVAKIFFAKGEGAERHAHPEEQVIYVLRGRLQVTLGEERYIVEAGQASYHPSNVPHEVLALEDTEAISFKNVVDPRYPATGELR